MKPKLAFIGDLTVDSYPKLNSAHLSGSSLTCALWAKKLGAKTTILAAVGDDNSGKQYKELFKKENLSLKFLKSLKSRTSNIEIFLDKNGERTWGEWNPGALAQYHLDKPEYDFLKTQDAVALPVYAKTKHLLDELLKIKPSKPLIAIDFDDLSQFPPSPRLRGASKSTKIIENHLKILTAFFRVKFYYHGIWYYFWHFHRPPLRLWPTSRGRGWGVFGSFATPRNVDDVAVLISLVDREQSHVFTGLQYHCPSPA